MGIFASLLTLIALIISIVASKKGERLTNPLVLFLGLWTLVLALSVLNPFGMDGASDTAYFLLIAMISCFTLGFVAFSLFKKKEPSPKTSAKG